MQQLGNYQLIRQIAVGGMAEVYLAKTAGVEGFEKIVALKMIHPRLATNAEFVTMLVNEAKIAAQLTHTNIAQTLDLGCVDGVYFIAMEYVDGIDAFNLIRASAYTGIMLPIDACALIVRDVAGALDHAHCKQDDAGHLLGIIHRDVSPDNVLISYEGVVKLVDFGIAKAAMKSTQSGIGTIKGKWLHMSPEQTRGEPLDPTSDIYSAGTVLYQLLTGRTLYDDQDLEQLVKLIRAGAFVPPSTFRTDVPPELDRIVVRALATDRSQRYQTADAMAGDLQAFLHRYSPGTGAGTLASLVSVVLQRAGVSTAPPAPAPTPPAPAPTPAAPAPAPSRRAPTLQGMGAASSDVPAARAASTPSIAPRELTNPPAKPEAQRWPTSEGSTNEVRAVTEPPRATREARAATADNDRETNVMAAQTFESSDVVLDRTTEMPTLDAPPAPPSEPQRVPTNAPRPSTESRLRPSRNVIPRKPKPAPSEPDEAERSNDDPSKQIEIEVD